MGRRKKRRRSGEEEATPVAKPAEPLNRPFADALAHVRLPPESPKRPPAPSSPSPDGHRRQGAPGRPSREAPREKPPEHAYEDRVAFAQAYSDVKPLAPRRARTAGGSAPVSRVVQGTPRQPIPDSREAEQRARARLDALVGGGVRFHVERDEGWVEGLQEGQSPALLRSMRQRGWSPEADLDLHGMTVEEASREVVVFLREGHRRGVRRVLLIHGRGAHSEGGVGVLGDRVVRVLTEGRAAPLVVAFATAPRNLGGEGALVVQLASK
jgi:DNA-nicking Smr family endonuclease